MVGVIRGYQRNMLILVLVAHIGCRHVFLAIDKFCLVW